MKQRDSIWYFQAALVSIGVGAGIYFVLTFFQLVILLGGLR